MSTACGKSKACGKVAETQKASANSIAITIAAKIPSQAPSYLPAPPAGRPGLRFASGTRPVSIIVSKCACGSGEDRFSHRTAERELSSGARRNESVEVNTTNSLCRTGDAGV
jgi:hypothetical protein